MTAAQIAWGGHLSRTDKEGAGMSHAYRTQEDVLEEQVLFGKCRYGRNAAREIAERIEAGHGFWDFEARKRAAQGEQGNPSSVCTSVVAVEVHDGIPRQFLAGGHVSGEETPRAA